MSESQKIWPALRAVMSKLGAIGKDRKNQQQNYAFRGIDDVYNEAHDVLAEAGVIMSVRVLERQVTETETKSGSRMLHVAEKIECDFVSCEDGSKHTYGPVWAEGLDMADKASNKCLSAAQKYAVLQTFLIPTKDIVDADAETPERGRPVQRDERPAPTQQTRPQNGGGRQSNASPSSAWDSFKNTNEPPNGDQEEPGAGSDGGTFAPVGDRIEGIPPDMLGASRAFVNKPFKAQSDVELAGAIAALDRILGKSKDPSNRKALAMVSAFAQKELRSRGAA